MKNKQTNNKNTLSLKTFSDLNKFDYGNGVYVSGTSHKDANDIEGTPKLFYTNKAPKLKIKGQEIDVEYSSVEQNDQALLHFLAGKL